jgi:predicted anti-sigma-YlaC factor YlaD
MATTPTPPVVSSTSPTPAPAQPPMSEGARIINTFIAPSKTFTDLRRSAMWWAPWILISIFSIAFMVTISKQIGFEQITRNQIAHSARADQFDKLPADQQARQVNFSVMILKVIAFANPAVVLLFSLIMTVILWATFKVGFAADTTFGQAFAIGMYAGLPGVLGAILGIISLFAGVNPEGFDINNPVATNLAYFLDPETTGKFVRGMASSLDLFIIWSIVLIGIGYSCTSKVKRSTAIIVVACLYVFWKLITSGLASLG